MTRSTSATTRTGSRQRTSLGTVVAFHPGAGFMGCNLADVRYTDPWAGVEETMPFGTANLVVGRRDELIAVAERFARQATLLRKLAEAGE